MVYEIKDLISDALTFGWLTLSLLSLGTAVLGAEDTGQVPERREIVGGYAPDPLENPFRYVVWVNGCTGVSLFDSQWVLTAAHCVEDAHPARVKVEFGWGTSYFETEYSQDVIVHPDYESSENASGNWAYTLHDVALVHLQAPLRVANPGAVLGSGQPVRANVGTQVIAAGWGRVYGNVSTDTLQAAEWTAASCNPDLIDGRISDDLHICIQGDDKTHGRVGIGDSGGPLFVQLEDGSYRVAGIVSVLEYAQGVHGADTAYSVYTRIRPYSEWIYGHLYSSRKPKIQIEVSSEFDSECSVDLFSFNDVSDYNRGSVAPNATKNFTIAIDRPAAPVRATLFLNCNPR